MNSYDLVVIGAGPLVWSPPPVALLLEQMLP